MNYNTQMENTMKACRQLKRFAELAMLVLVAVVTLSPLSSATGTVVKSDLTGNWQIALRGTTGCGFSSMMANVTLNSAGSGNGTLQTHGQCGDSTVSGVTFTVQTLKATGQGTAGLSCGAGCGWTFNIQVAPDRSSFNLVDVSAANPGNFVEGTAILTSPSGNIVTADLAGSWQMTLYGQGGCGVATTLVTFTLNSSGVSNNATETAHTAGCGDTSSSGNTFTVQSLSSDGRGVAGLSCGTGCGFTFNIQVSPDRSTFNLVDVSATNPLNFLAGVAINNSTAGKIVNANLSGKWQVALYTQGGCGIASTLVTFTLNAQGSSANATEISHSAGCGDSTTTGNSFKIQSLNANGSGTAGLTCGTGCGFTYNIQVSPDRSTMSLVDVSALNPANFQAGTGIHQ